MNVPVQFSVDTRHVQTARRALDMGIHWINDVTGFSDPAMLTAVKASDCKLVVMHSLGIPVDKKFVMTQPDVVPVLLQWAKYRINNNIRAGGISADRIIFDPGIGFGKSAQQSMMILRNVERFRELGVPILIGHSRKSFFAELGVYKIEDRDDATLAVSYYLAQHGVDYLRVHNMARHKQMLAIVRALHG